MHNKNKNHETAQNSAVDLWLLNQDIIHSKTNTKIDKTNLNENTRYHDTINY